MQNPRWAIRLGSAFVIMALILGILGGVYGIGSTHPVDEPVYQNPFRAYGKNAVGLASSAELSFNLTWVKGGGADNTIVYFGVSEGARCNAES